MIGMIQEADGKVSFSRTFGALISLSVLAGWWLELLTDAGLPELTNEILAIALVPYGIAKVSGAWVSRSEERNAGARVTLTGPPDSGAEL
jgi:hypothetical protein